MDQLVEEASLGKLGFERLVVWQKAHQFVLAVYQVTKDFPAEEKFGHTSQLRRASVSIPANIAEGYAKQSDLDKKRFYNIAQGSLNEVRYYLLLVKDLEYADTANLLLSLDEIGKMLYSYASKVGSPKLDASS